MSQSSFPIPDPSPFINFSTDAENSSATASSSPTTADEPSPAKEARQELEADFGKGDAIKKKKKLGMNWKMAVGITLGVLVGVAVLAIIIAATHGAALAPLILAAKALLAHSGISSAIGGLTALSHSAFVAEAIISLAILFGAGGVAGALFRRGEQESLQKLLTSSDKALKTLEGDSRIDIDKIEEHQRFEQSTITSSQAGRNFIELGRRSRLQSLGVKTLGLFGYFWSAIPGVATRSLGSDQAQYGKRMEHYDREVDLKMASAGDLEALKKLKFLQEGDTEATQKAKQNALNALNNLRGIQIRQFIGKNGAASEAYNKAPEILSIDMNLAKLRLLLSTEEEPSKEAGIRSRILIEEEKKSQLIEIRMEKGTNEHNAVFAPKSSIKSLFSISRDIDHLEGLDDEQKGQILEATAIFLEEHPDATIEDINALVDGLNASLKEHNGDLTQTRSGVIVFAQKFPLLSKMEEAQKTRSKLSDDPKNIGTSEEKAPMSIGRGALLGKLIGLRALDVAIVAAHSLPGGTALSVAPTALSVGIEKGGFRLPEWGSSHEVDQIDDDTPVIDDTPAERIQLPGYRSDGLAF